MNYFEIFDLPISFHVSKSSLSKAFIQLQKKTHPDFFANSSDAEKAEALEKSALANQAYKVLQNPEATIKYILQQKGLLQDEEKYELPPQFLMEVLELNEMKMDGAEPAKIKQQAENLQTEITQNVQSILDHFDDEKTSSKDLLKVKDYYYKKKYLSRILAS